MVYARFNDVTFFTFAVLYVLYTSTEIIHWATCTVPYDTVYPVFLPCTAVTRYTKRNAQTTGVVIFRMYTLVSRLKWHEAGTRVTQQRKDAARNNNHTVPLAGCGRTSSSVRCRVHKESKAVAVCRWIAIDDDVITFWLLWRDRRGCRGENQPVITGNCFNLS